MPPKAKKLVRKKKAKPDYQTTEADLQAFGGVKVRQLVRNALGCTGSVLGVRSAPAGGPSHLWVRYDSGLEAPIDAESLQPCDPVDQLRREIKERQQEERVLDGQWANYNAEQQRKEEEAQRAAARRRQKAAAAAAAAAAEQAGAEGQQRGRSREVKAVSTAASLAGRSKQAAAA